MATTGIRPEITSRRYKVMTYQAVDHIPDVEFGFWAQTIRKWAGEGVPFGMTDEELALGYSPKVQEFFGFDDSGCTGLALPVHMNPTFEVKELERHGDVVLRQGPEGQVAETYMDDTENSSIPHYISFPVKTPDDWRAMKERYRLDDPERTLSREDLDNVRKAVARGRFTLTSASGPYGQLRDWMGFENLSVAFYEHPEMVHDMVEHWTGLCLDQIRKVPDDIPIDMFGWWEDMASKNGPFVSPAMFREFLQPCYHAIMTEVHKRGCVLASVDCDGNPYDIVPNWLEEGVNLVYPLEVPAGVDAWEWRREFGRELRLQGGIAKRPLRTGRDAIDAELERIKPLLEDGGYIPHVDHLVPPDIPYDNYRYYLDKKRELIGKC